MRPELLDRLAVVGGGVTGLTTAVQLQLYGYRTVMYTDRQATREMTANRLPPEFASVHAAASVLPHGVRSTSAIRWTAISQRYFEALAFRATCGVRKQRHFEVYEHPVAPPTYESALAGFELLLSGCSAAKAPSRQGSVATHGWSFDAYFCEGPTYLRFLEDLYAGLGGELVLTDTPVTLDLMSVAGHSVVVNCTGIGAAAFLQGDIRDDGTQTAGFAPLMDACPPRVVRGHWIRARVSAPLTIAGIGRVSYNYTPVHALYPAADNRPGDVYCYPRSDAWVLGGSRQELMDPGRGTWAASDVRTIEMPDGSGGLVSVPAVILELNADLVGGLSNGAIDLQGLFDQAPARFSGGVGYRFERNHPTESVRIERSLTVARGRRMAVVHNYGHGGAGFTMSWGCATDVLRNVQELREQGWRMPVREPQGAAEWDDLRGLLAAAEPGVGTGQGVAP